MRILVLLLIVAIYSGPLAEEILIKGRVVDSENGSPLPVANIQIKDTYQGTITNKNGFFILKTSNFPITIKSRYIGYQSREITFNGPPEKTITIALTPSTIQMPEIIVDGKDPAYRIMEQVIKRKKEWRKKLSNYKCEGYARFNLSNDSMMVFIGESVSEIYWKKNKGTKEIIKSRANTKNIPSDRLAVPTSDFPNLYDDDVEIADFRFIGPTHPRAFEYYYFRLMDYRSMDEKKVYRIEVKPKTKIQPAFEGTLFVLDEDFALLEARLKPAKHVIFPIPIEEYEIFHSQKFHNFNKDFWLPTDLEIEGTIKVGVPGLNFPKVNYYSLYSINNYHVNIDIPDSIFIEKNRVKKDFLKNNNRTLIQEKRKIPLSKKELTAFEEIDSTLTVEKAFKPRGLLARFAKFEVTFEDSTDTLNTKKATKFSSDFTPSLEFNRVDGFKTGLTSELTFFETTTLTGYYGRSIQGEYDNWSFKCYHQFTQGIYNINFGVEYGKNSVPTYHSEIYGKTFSGLKMLLGAKDYFDYYQNENFLASINLSNKKIKSSLHFSYHGENHKDLEKSTDWQLINEISQQRENPPISEGRVDFLKLSYQWGEDYVPLGVVGFKRILMEGESSLKGFRDNDVSFKRAEVVIDFRFNTFMKRTIFPNTLDIRIKGGKLWGDKIPQKRFFCDGSLGFFNAFGGFHSVKGILPSGDKILSIHWEHNFRGVPFQLLNMNFIAKRKWEFILLGGHGKIWNDSNSATYNEIGFAFNKIGQYLRLNCVHNWDKKTTYATLSFSRLF